jgi:hypothetical protein
MENVIINNGTLTVQGDNGCLQSFHFNFLHGNCHLSIVELLCELGFSSSLNFSKGWYVTGGWSFFLWTSDHWSSWCLHIS